MAEVDAVVVARESDRAFPCYFRGAWIHASAQVCNIIGLAVTSRVREPLGTDFILAVHSRRFVWSDAGARRRLEPGFG